MVPPGIALPYVGSPRGAPQATAQEVANPIELLLLVMLEKWVFLNSVLLFVPDLVMFSPDE